MWGSPAASAAADRSLATGDLVGQIWRPGLQAAGASGSGKQLSDLTAQVASLISSFAKSV